MKRIFSLSLVVSLLIASVSCGSAEPAETPAGSQSSDTSAEAVTTAEPSEYTKPEADYGGETVTIASYKYDGSWAILKYNNLLTEENGDVINDAIVERNRQVESDLNIKLDLLVLDQNDRGSSAKLQKLILAGEDSFAFAMSMNANLAPMLTTSGMLVDLNSIDTLDLSHSWWNQNANDEYTIYGKQYAAVGDICFFNLGAPVVTYFSKQLAEDNKLDSPYQLVYDGKWTVDNMMKLATDASRDLNGNQTVDKDDQFGLALEPDSLGYFLMAEGVRLSEHTADGDISIKVNGERTINACEKLVNFFYSEKTTLVADFLKSKFNSDWANVHSDYLMPKLMNNQLLFYANQLLVSLNLRAMQSDFGILPLPKYDENQANYVSFANTWFSDHVIVPATSAKLELTGNVLECMGYYSQQIIRPAFVDTTVMGKSVRDEDSAKMVQLVYDTQTFDVAYIFDWGGVKSNFSNMVRNNNAAFATSYAAIENKVTAALGSTIDELKG